MPSWRDQIDTELLNDALLGKARFKYPESLMGHCGCDDGLDELLQDLIWLGIGQDIGFGVFDGVLQDGLEFTKIAIGGEQPICASSMVRILVAKAALNVQLDWASAQTSLARRLDVWPQTVTTATSSVSTMMTVWPNSPTRTVPNSAVIIHLRSSVTVEKDAHHCQIKVPPDWNWPQRLPNPSATDRIGDWLCCSWVQRLLAGFGDDFSSVSVCIGLISTASRSALALIFKNSSSPSGGIFGDCDRSARMRS